MPSKKSAARATPKAPGSSALSSTHLTATQARRSALLKHSFSPSALRANLFASVIQGLNVQGLNVQVLRFHDTLAGALRCEYSLGECRISCLDWGIYDANPSDDRPIKKRKTQGHTADAVQDQGDAVVAIGAVNLPGIEIFSPSRGRVVASLRGAHNQGIRDFKFLAYGTSRKAWSLGGDGKLVEWSLDDGSPTRVITLSEPASASTVLCPSPSSILCAHASIYAIDPSSPTDCSSFHGFATPVKGLATQRLQGGGSQIEAVLGISESERYVTVFGFSDRTIRGSLNASDSVELVSLPDQTDSRLPALAAVTERGTVEVFQAPFEFKDPDKKSAEPLKSSQSAKVRRPSATIRICRPAKPTENVPIVDAVFDGNELVVVWIEGAVHPCFEHITWLSAQGQLVLKEETLVEKSKPELGVASVKLNGHDLGKTQVDDSQTVVVQGQHHASEGMEVDEPEVINVSSAEEESSEESEEDEQSAVDETLVNGVRGTASADYKEPNEHNQDSRDQEEASDKASQVTDEVEEPSFGDLLRAKNPEPVDVSPAFSAKAQNALVPQGEKSLSLPSGMSLGTVLAQSLRTDDRELLETCFHVQDLQIVRATIERLDAALAGALLEKLAERFHNRPGRAGSLMVWIQWTLVAHGGYLAGRPKVFKQLKQLHSVVRERAQALQPLLLLKGKLDMLEAQMRLRKNMIERSRALQAAREDEEEDAIFVEGQKDEDSESELEQTQQLEGGETRDAEDIDFDASDDEGEQMPDAMGVDDDEADEEEFESADGMIDDEAEEDEADEDDDASEGDEDIDHDDVDSLDEAASDSEESSLHIPTKARVNGIGKRR